MRAGFIGESSDIKSRLIKGGTIQILVRVIVESDLPCEKWEQLAKAVCCLEYIFIKQ